MCIGLESFIPIILYIYIYIYHYHTCFTGYLDSENVDYDSTETSDCGSVEISDKCQLAPNKLFRSW